MSRRFLVGAGALACALIGLGMDSRAADKEAPGKDVFGTTKVWAIHLEIPAKEYDAMQPATGFGPPGGAPPAPKDKRESERNLFGTEFPWAQGDLSAEGKTYKQVGLRYSGEIAYFASAQGLKRPLTIDF